MQLNATSLETDLDMMWYMSKLCRDIIFFYLVSLLDSPLNTHYRYLSAFKIYFIKSFYILYFTNRYQS